MTDHVAKLRRITASGRANHLSKADRLRIADRIAALEAENARAEAKLAEARADGLREAANFLSDLARVSLLSYDTCKRLDDISAILARIKEGE